MAGLRVAVLADVHADLTALEAVLAEVDAAGWTGSCCSATPWRPASRCWTGGAGRCSPTCR